MKKEDFIKKIPDIKGIERRTDDRFSRIEKTVALHSEKIDFFVRTSLPPENPFF